MRMEDNKGCLVTIIGIAVFIIIGNLLFKAIDSAGNYIAIILAILAGAAFLGFIIMCIRGMKK